MDDGDLCVRLRTPRPAIAESQNRSMQRFSGGPHSMTIFVARGGQLETTYNWPASLLIYTVATAFAAEKRKQIIITMSPSREMRAFKTHSKPRNKFQLSKGDNLSDNVRSVMIVFFSSPTDPLAPSFPYRLYRDRIKLWPSDIFVVNRSAVVVIGRKKRMNKYAIKRI